MTLATAIIRYPIPLGEAAKLKSLFKTTINTPIKAMNIPKKVPDLMGSFARKYIEKGTNSGIVEITIAATVGATYFNP